MTKAWILLGCGYAGRAVAARLATAELYVTRRTLAAAEATAGEVGARAGFAVDFARPETLAALPRGAVVVCLAPPGPDPAAEVAALAACAPSRLVYVSSTAVYGAAGGAWVDEEWPIAPVSTAGRARVAAEGALPAGAIALRVAGIYGPGRGLAERLRAGTLRIIGDGRAHVSRIHVDDLAAAIVRAGETSVAGAVNIADDDPAPIGELADRIAIALGLPLPPRVDPASVSADVAAMLTADRRIANARMKRELGVVLRHPRVAV